MLNLSQFMADPGFGGKLPPTMWANPNFCNAIIDTIAQYCPTMTTLDLSGNGILSMHLFQPLVTKCAHLVNINLSDNQLKVPLPCNRAV